MATKKPSTAKETGSESAHVTRITTKAVAKKPAKETDVTPVTPRSGSRNPFKAFWRGLRNFGGYFKGAWYELREVRWPNRSQTWSMTGALIGFTAVFVVLILLLDALFKYLFELILK